MSIHFSPVHIASDYFLTSQVVPPTNTVIGGVNPGENLVLRSTTNATKGQVFIDETTASTSITTGALRVAGGVGIAGAVYAGSANFTTLSAPHGGLSGLLDDSHTQYSLLAGRSGGQITTGGTASGNNLILRSTTNATKGQVFIDETTASTSVITGALRVGGGVGIAGAVFAGSANFSTLTAPHGGLSGLSDDSHTQYSLLAGRSGGQILTGGTAASNTLILRSTSNATKGQVYIDETTASTSITTGALRVDGGVGIDGDIYLSGKVNAKSLAKLAPTSNVITDDTGSINASGYILMNSTSTNLIGFNSQGAGAPTFTSRSVGTKIALLPAISPSTADIAIGVGTSSLWNSVRNSSDSFIWYAGTSNRMQLYGDGTLYLTSNNGGASTILQVLDSNTTASKKTVRFGHNSLINNSGELSFQLVGVGNATNNIGLGISGHPATLNVTATGIAAVGTFDSSGRVNLNNTTTIVNTDNTFTNTDGALAVSGDIVLTNNTNSIIGFKAAGLGAPTFTTRSNGSKILIYPDIAAGKVDMALGVENTGMWSSIRNTTDSFYWYSGTTRRMTLSGLGNLTVTGNLAVSGALSKGSGTFNIEHPLDPKRRLIHSFIEGPRCDNIYRGKTNLVDGEAVVNLDIDCTETPDCAMTEGTFQALNKNPQWFLENLQGWEQIRGSLSGNKLTIKSRDHKCQDLISWMVIAERKDKFIKNWERTNTDGHLITEYTE